MPTDGCGGDSSRRVTTRDCARRGARFPGLVSCSEPAQIRLIARNDKAPAESCQLDLRRKQPLSATEISKHLLSTCLLEGSRSDAKTTSAGKPVVRMATAGPPTPPMVWGDQRCGVPPHTRARRLSEKSEVRNRNAQKSPRMGGLTFVRAQRTPENARFRLSPTAS